MDILNWIQSTIFGALHAPTQYTTVTEEDDEGARENDLQDAMKAAMFADPWFTSRGARGAQYCAKPAARHRVAPDVTNLAKKSDGVEVVPRPTALYRLGAKRPSRVRSEDDQL